MYHVLCVMCHVSCILCHVSCVMCCVSCVICVQEESCIATLRGTECATWQTIMIEVFKIGEAYIDIVVKVFSVHRTNQRGIYFAISLRIILCVIIPAIGGFVKKSQILVIGSENQREETTVARIYPLALGINFDGSYLLRSIKGKNGL